MKLLIHSQTSTLQRLKFGNEYAIASSSHILLDMCLVIHAGIKVNPYKQNGVYTFLLQWCKTHFQYVYTQRTENSHTECLILDIRYFEFFITSYFRIREETSIKTLASVAIRKFPLFHSIYPDNSVFFYLIPGITQNRFSQWDKTVCM